jgi:hypothetical protein
MKTKKKKGDIFCESGWGWQCLRAKSDVSGVEPSVSVITQFLGKLGISMFQLKKLRKQEWKARRLWEHKHFHCAPYDSAYFFCVGIRYNPV